MEGFVKAILVAVAAVGAILVTVGCACVECGPCRQSGSGFCGGGGVSCFSCGDCPTLCPGFCASDAGTAAKPCVTDAAGSYRTFVIAGFGADWNPVAH